MITIKRILVPIDFGQTSQAALDYGVELTRLFGARLHLLHVFDLSTGVREYPTPDVPFSRGSGDYDVRQFLGETDRRELRPVVETRRGAPADEILDYASERDIDLVVMGTHGREGLARVLLGSVAETVVRKANCPVLTVHNRQGEVVAENARAAGRVRAEAPLTA